jgi:hypothetical protein
VYTGGNSKAILAAVRDFTENYPDPKAAIIATAEVTVANLVDIWVIFFFYNGAQPPAHVFQNFTKLYHMIDATKTRSLDDLMRFNDNFIVKNSIYTIGTESTVLPNKTMGVEVMQGFYDSWHANALSVKGVSGVVASIAFQPMPKRITQISKESGGVVMDMDDSVDRIIFELDYSYWYAKDDARIDQVMQKTYTELGSTVKRFQQEGKLPEAHLPLFMNDMYFRQDFWGRLKDKSKHVAVAKKYDPEGFFTNSKRVQGFFMRD